MCSVKGITEVHHAPSPGCYAYVQSPYYYSYVKLKTTNYIWAFVPKSTNLLKHSFFLMKVKTKDHIQTDLIQTLSASIQLLHFSKLILSPLFQMCVRLTMHHTCT